jgi:hypothetical protein
MQRKKGTSLRKMDVMSRKRKRQRDETGERQIGELETERRLITSHTV